ncbi:ABC transporter ATP-binding protein [Rubeoparvulum massiliense]|uniref:ABC transporter ATP-binding protein n=1 Tax=Rubeoparvulum massiliense TaxID=1631346 RepID=UPI00065E24FD|nr:ATP-binding cassette domain-containing protein [Rubeoparvulum massiliense]
MQLNASNLGFHYPNGPWIFRHLDITLQTGEVVGLTGPSGSGKTTLARILAGYEEPHEGQVTLHGGMPSSSASHTAAFHPVQLIFQHPEKAVNPRWRMRQTLYEGWNPPDEFLHDLGIEQAWLNRWPNELSGGELQRFCVARALSPATQFLIADEMTAMLDAITQAQIWQVIQSKVEAQQLGVLMISHDQHLLQRLATRMISLSPYHGKEPSI